MESKIINAIVAIMDETGAIGKDKKNQQQGFMFRGIDQVMNVLHPLLAKHGVVIVPEVLETKREERSRYNKEGVVVGSTLYTMHKVKYHFIADDASEICATVIGEGMDVTDKSSNKAMAIAFKYACFQVFCIPTEEMSKDDPDNYMPEPSSISEQQVKAYIGNCFSREELLMLSDSYGNNIKASASLTSAFKARWAEVPEKGGAR